MDYEKKYNEALERARALRNEAIEKEYVDDYIKDYETIFPELRESESKDERIRKALVKQFGGCIKDDEFCHTGFTYAEITAWLEKQKEQKPNIELIQRSWYMEGYHDRDFFMEPKWILKTGEGGPKHEPNPRYGKSLILGTEPCCCSVNVESEYDKGWRDGHKAGLKDAEMQNPAWSEEDESMLWNIISIVGQCKSVQADSMLDWLKSLRPCPSWKPSEEQMKALYEAAQDAAIDREGGNALYELYEHLKRLYETIQAIKAEIERLIEESDFDESANLYSLLSFLDTLESEKPMQEGLEEEVDAYMDEHFDYNAEYNSIRLKGNFFPSPSTLLDIARHFAKWGADHTPLPEDTVLFQKGVAEGKRLMMEDAVEIGTTDIYWEPDGDRAFPAFDPPVEDLLMPDIISQKFNDGDKVRIIVIPNTDEK